jgi:hypothetical protein
MALVKGSTPLIAAELVLIPLPLGAKRVLPLPLPHFAKKAIFAREARQRQLFAAERQPIAPQLVLLQSHTACGM